MDKIEVINYHQVVQHKGIKFWCYNAGHVLGAAMFMIEIAGIKVFTNCIHFHHLTHHYLCHPRRYCTQGIIRGGKIVT